MTVCKKKRFVKWQICIGDLRHPIQILNRAQGNTEYGDLEPTETFTVLASPRAAIETVRGTTRFKNVNIAKAATHLFFIKYTLTLDALDHANNFVKFKLRYYKVLSLENQDEDNQYIIIQCEERGLTTKLANEA